MNQGWAGFLIRLSIAELQRSQSDWHKQGRFPANTISGQERQPTLASPPCPIQFSTVFCMMAERTSGRTDLTVLAFIFGAIVIVVSLGSLLLTLLAVIGVHI
jgi:hypothetical protein